MSGVFVAERGEEESGRDSFFGATAEAYRYADENVDAFSDAMEEKGWKIDFVQMVS